MATLRSFDDLSDYRDRFQESPDPDVWWETVTPARAQELLQRNRGNRNISKNTLTHYAGDMAAGRWRLTGDPIRITADGRVLDGQHRLTAIVRSGVTLKLLICRLPDASAMDAIDTGKRRTFGDYLKIRGVGSSSELSSIIRTYHLLARYMERDVSDTSAPHAVLWQIYQDTPADYWQRALRVGAPPEIRRLQMRRTLPACYVAICKNGDQALADEFADHIRTGASLREGDPIHTLRKTAAAVAATRTRSLEIRGKLMLIVKAWNFWVRGDDLQIIKLAGQVFPKLEKAPM